MKIIKVQEVVLADDFLKRFLGYMFKSIPSRREVLIIEPCNSIHTFFMKFNIDVLFLDKENRVLEVKRNLPRRKMVPPIRGTIRVVEAKAGLFGEIEKGELIRFETC